MSQSRRYFLETEQIGLAPLEPSMAEGPYGDWFNDPEVCRYNSHHRFPKTRHEIEKFIETSGKFPDALVFAVIEKSSGKHIGNVSLQSIHWIDRSGELAIVLGEKSSWGKGYATQAWGLLIEHAFKTLNLQRIFCGLREDNIGMRKVAEKLGMKLEGTQERAVFKDGRFWNLINFAKLKELP